MSNFATEEFIRQLVAQLAPGAQNLNTLVVAGFAHHIHANFDRVPGGAQHDQRVDINNHDKRKARIVRPGAIILPNLDIDGDGPPRARRLYRRSDERDVNVNGPNDVHDITLFTLAAPPIIQGQGNADRVVLRVDPADARRIRIWRIPHGQNADGVGVAQVIGPGAPPVHEYQVWAAPGPVLNHPVRFVAESLVMLGDPRPGFAPPAHPTANPPGLLRTPLPDTSGGSEAAPVVNATNTADPVYGGPLPGVDRDPGDVWVEVIHEFGGVVQANLNDVGLFTIAPWIMTWNTLPCQRVYVAYLTCPNRVAVNADVTFDDGIRLENHSMVWELRDGCAQAGLTPAPLPVVPGIHATGARIPISNGANIQVGNEIPFYVIDADYVDYDLWVQDEFEIGYCAAPHNHVHIVLHTPREDRHLLGKFVRRRMAHPGLGVFDAVSATVGATNEPLNFGGNLEVSPPVPNATSAIRRDAGGPTVKAHRRAPFGKILLGDCAAIGFGRHVPVSPELRDFLVAQRVQPVLPLCTSWLDVGHVDEFLSFVRATGPRGYKLLIANVRLMTLLLEEILRVDPAATIHTGKYNKRPNRYHETFVEDWIGRVGGGGNNARRKFSERVEREKLSKIRSRLKAGLDITEEYILSVPTYWENKQHLVVTEGYVGSYTIAENVGMVNMLVVNDYLMVPRPHGPRLPPADAQKVVERTIERWFGYANAPPVPTLAAIRTLAQDHRFWARPGETAAQIAMYFARPPRNINSAVDRVAWRGLLLQRLRGQPAGMQLTVSQVAALTPLENHIGGQLPANLLAADTFPDWQRVNINDDTVDVFELYMKSILENIGNTVHFVEDYESYHAMSGEVHCGTNAKREPPEVSGGFTDRWWDQGVYDPDYDTTYVPHL